MSRPPLVASVPCSGCGLAVPGGTAGCQAIFEGLLERDFSDAAYFRVHRLMVDAYSLQHPERYCVSVKSLAAHLTGLCWLDGASRLSKPEIPPVRGTLTIAEVRGAHGPEAHALAVERWARSVWEAWSDLHELARGWIGQALAGA
ncbi:MAG: DUF5946 family protein [Planctomycetota bacterium]